MSLRDIIVGGAGDRLFGCARRYADDLKTRHPERDVLYLTQGRRRALLAEIESGRPVNLIGHSWGAADVAWALARTDARNVQRVIGVDPVGKLRRWRSCETAAPTLTVWARGSEGRLTDGNATAAVGRALGPACPAVFARTDHHIDTPFAHYDMLRMMLWAGEDGVSAEGWMLTE